MLVLPFHLQPFQQTLGLAHLLLQGISLGLGSPECVIARPGIPDRHGQHGKQEYVNSGKGSTVHGLLLHGPVRGQKNDLVLIKRSTRLFGSRTAPVGISHR